MTEGDRLGASWPSRTPSASWKSPAEMPRRYRIGSRASKLVVRRAQRGSSAEPDALGCRVGSPVADLEPLDLDWPDPGLDHAFRPMTMPDQAVPAVGQLQVLLRRQESFHLGLNGLFEQPARSRPQKRGQRIVDRVGLAKVDNAAILVHGVSLPRGGSGRFVAYLDTPPSSPRHHPVSAIARSPDKLR